MTTQSLRGGRLFRLLIFPVFLAACAGGCAHTVYPPARPKDPVKVYLAYYGWHTGVLLPKADRTGRLGAGGQFVEFIFGDWDYMTHNKESFFDGVGAMFASQQAGLGRRVITIRNDKVAADVKTPPLRITRFYASAGDVRKLTDELEARFRSEDKTAAYNPEDQTVYVRDGQHYGLDHNCSHTARQWLEELGCDVRGSIVTFGFDLAGTQQIDPGAADDAPDEPTVQHASATLRANRD